MASRTLVLGDIHGCLTALEAILSAVDAGPGDTLVVLGDMIDRGPDSFGVIEKLLSFKTVGNLVSLRGNHEIMMIQAMNTGNDEAWIRSGGYSTLKSFGHRGKGPWRETVPSDFELFLRNDCVDYWESDEFVMTHAGLEAGLPLSDQPESTLFWSRLETAPLAHFSGKISIHGHSIMPDFQPWAWPHAWYLDTGAYLADGWLTCVEIQSRQIWQANQKGIIRPGVWTYPLDHR